MGLSVSDTKILLRGGDHLSVARQAVETLFRTEGGRQGLWFMGGDPWVWNGERWSVRSKQEIEKHVIEWLEEAHIITAESEEGYTTQKATEVFRGHDMREVVWIVERLCQAPVQSIPRWLEAGEWPDPDHCIAFSDVVLDVKGTAAKRKVSGLSAADGPLGMFFGMITYPRDDRFFGPGVLTVPLNPEARCPVWNKAMGEWSGGDGKWIDVRERAYGYACMATRKYGKALLEYGKSQSGKGSGTNAVLSKLMMSPAYHSAAVDQVIGDHGWDGLHQAQVWVVPEIRDMDRGEGKKFATVLKIVLGGDAGMVNIKYVRQLRGVRFRAFPMMQSNTMPAMPDDAGAVSSKLIILPFRNSFADKRDDDLPAKLGQELPGIAARFAEGAIRLEMAEGKDKWPIVDGAQEIMAQMALEGNAFDAFLKWGFVPSEGSRVSHEYICAKRAEFEATFGVKLNKRDGRRVTDSQLLFYLENDASWKVRKEESQEGKSVLRGVGMRSLV